MFLCDMQKGFESIECLVLLDRLCQAGVNENEKTWQLLRSWYDVASCQVQCEGALSSSFTVERGVKQGSVFSPTDFLLVMDPLLQQLELSELRLSVDNFYAGRHGFLHADDIRTLATSIDSLNAQ